METEITKLEKPENCVIVIIDMQEKLLPAISGAESVLQRAVKLVQFAKIMVIPIVLTEQQKLGKTVPQINDELTDIEPIPKLSFSCFGSEDFVRTIAELGKKTLILAGIEAHICVFQTAMHAVASYRPYVISDAVSSRSLHDCQSALDRMRQHHITLTTMETLMYELLEKAGTDRFRKILPLIK